MRHETRRIAAAVFATLLLSQLNAAEVNWQTDVESSLLQAKQSGRLVLMKFTADWCTYCKKMERETFTNIAVAQSVNAGFIPVLVDADQHKELVKHLEIRGLPAVLIVSPDMIILERISGYQTEDKLLPKLEAAVAKHYGVRDQSSTIATAPGFTPSPARPVSQSAQTAYAPALQNTQARPAVFDEPAFGGLCLSGVNESRSLISGMPQLAIKYRGKTLYFSSEEMQTKFLEDPIKYWPQRDGVCPVTLLEQGQVVEGNLEFAAMFRGQLWVTQSAEAMQKFVAAPARYVDALPTP